MRLMLTGRNVEVTPALRQMVERRLAKLERLLADSAVSAQVVLTRERHRHVTDVTLHARGDHVLSGLGAATSWPLSAKEAVEKITLQAKRVKGKWQERKRRVPGTKRLPVPEIAGTPVPHAAEDTTTPAPRVVRVRYAVRTLTPQEAATRVAAGTDPFLLFRHHATGRVAVALRRGDGAVGLIEPDA